MEVVEAPRLEVSSGYWTGEGSSGGFVGDGILNLGESGFLYLQFSNTGLDYAEDLMTRITVRSPCVKSYDGEWRLLDDVADGDVSEYMGFSIESVPDGGGCSYDDIYDTGFSMVMDEGALSRPRNQLNVPIEVEVWDQSGHKWRTDIILPIARPNTDLVTFELVDDYGDQPAGQDYRLFFTATGETEGILDPELDEAILYYACTPFLDGDQQAGNGFISSADMSHCPESNGCGYNWKAKITPPESCEGERIYSRIRFKKDGVWYWSYMLPFMSGNILDDDTSPPSVGAMADTGDSYPEDLYEFTVELSDASGIRDSSYYPLVYYGWDDAVIDDTSFDGILVLSEDSGEYTASFNVSEVHEGERLYWRVFAGDGDNSPEYGWSSVRDGGVVAMRPPSIPTLYDPNVSLSIVFLDWSDAFDGSGVRDYEVEEVEDFKDTGDTVFMRDIPVPGVNHYSSNTSGLVLAERYGTLTYRVRARDNKGNWGGWSNTKTVQVDDNTIFQCTGSSPPAYGDWLVSEDSVCSNDPVAVYGDVVFAQASLTLDGVLMLSSTAGDVPAPSSEGGIPSSSTCARSCGVDGDCYDGLIDYSLICIDGCCERSPLRF